MYTTNHSDKYLLSLIMMRAKIMRLFSCCAPYFCSNLTESKMYQQIIIE
jgi:hypothetical protein